MKKKKPSRNDIVNEVFRTHLIGRSSLSWAPFQISHVNQVQEPLQFRPQNDFLSREAIVGCNCWRWTSLRSSIQNLHHRIVHHLCPHPSELPWSPGVHDRTIRSESAQQSSWQCVHHQLSYVHAPGSNVKIRWILNTYLQMFARSLLLSRRTMNFLRWWDVTERNTNCTPLWNWRLQPGGYQLLPGPGVTCHWCHNMYDEQHSSIRWMMGKTEEVLIN